MAADDPWAQLAAELGVEDQPVAAKSERAEASPARKPRRRRSRKADEPPADQEDPVALEVPQDAEVETEADVAVATVDDAPKKKRRRRSRKKKPTAGEEATAATPTADGPDDDAGPPESFADLKMPSWQELIDGLFRPDR